MTVASQLILVPGDAPASAPAGMRVLYLDGQGALCSMAPDGTIHKPREPEDNAYYLLPVLGFYDPTNGEPELPGAPDRYIASVTANGWTAGRIYQFAPPLGPWVETIPVTGALAVIGDVPYQYDGTTWEQVAYYAAAPGAYHRSAAWTVGAAHTELDAPVIYLRLNERGYRIGAYVSISLNEAEAWCAADIDVYGDFTNPLLRAGKDFYLYAIESASGASILVSPRSTYPTGYTEATSRKIGGFHCLCTDVGVISGHPLSGYVAGDILPASVWDLKHRPVCAPEGMVYVAGINRWVDIYLASVSGGKLVSVNGGAIADGATPSSTRRRRSSSSPPRSRCGPTFCTAPARGRPLDRPALFERRVACRGEAGRAGPKIP
ncbi:MAG: hypothetical protein ACP59X_03485 [Solidesulfovibrio sp. DCME]|uniref:phage major tropism determinant n=1 Tax=Solidesulfovibrio sp. DCME TaxID=3447380 RepID=UPI003D0BDEBC